MEPSGGRRGPSLLTEIRLSDVPTTPRGEGDVASSHMRERPRGKLRLTGLRGISLVRVVLAAQDHSSSFIHLTTAVTCLSTARQTAHSPR